MFILKPQSGTPIYRQLFEQVRRLVASGRLEAGTPMPSVRELAREHAVNPMTISKAYSLLEAEGILERHRGKPMTVAAGKARLSGTDERLLRIESQAAELTLAARQLGLTKKQVARLLDRLWEDLND